jgi:MoxR-like ATPase
MATQNPIEHEGTHPLPEAQLDRFMMRITLGYPGKEEEKKILTIVPERALLEELTPVVRPAELLEMQRQAAGIYMAGPLKGYIVDLAGATRRHPDLLLGISPRGSQHLYRAAKAAAFMEGRDHVLPDDIKAMAPPVFTHRLILKPEARLKEISAGDVLQEILHHTGVPVKPDDRN